MVKYEKARMEVIEFEAEDVITTSSCDANLNICGAEVPADGNDDMW